ncbi:hypothetical protein SAMN05428977_10742 [Nitrosomonas sp. Nm166]|nr:hypothetical protein SAMN05428977_10742 [Nitrosomonas sp. Nm166]
MSEARAHDAKAATSLPLVSAATYVFDRAYSDYDWFAQLTKQNIHFVTHMKRNTLFKIVSSQRVTGRVSADESIRLTSSAGNRYPGCLRRIGYTTEEGKQLVFITNDFKRSLKPSLICTKCAGGSNSSSSGSSRISRSNVSSVPARMQC